MQQRRYVLMSIKPQYANLIRNGKKTVELRRVAPHVSPGDVLIIYESTPIRKVTSYAIIEDLLQLGINDLWNQVEEHAMLDKPLFDSYFSGKTIGNGIILKDVVSLPHPKELKIIPHISVPQNYRYLSEYEFAQLCL